MPTMKFNRSGSGGGSSLTRATQVSDAYGVSVSADLPAAQPGVLTTRNSNTDGVITMNSPTHGILTGNKFSIFWSSGLIFNVIAGTVSGVLVPFSLESIGIATGLAASGDDPIVGGESDDDEKWVGRKVKDDDEETRRFGEDEKEEEDERTVRRKNHSKRYEPAPKKVTTPDVPEEESKSDVEVTPAGVLVVGNTNLPMVGAAVMAGLRVTYTAGWSFVGNDVKSMFCGASVPWCCGFFFASGGGPNDVAVYGSIDPAGAVKTVDLVNNVVNDGRGVIDTNPFTGETLASIQVSHGSPSPATVSAAVLTANP